MNRFERDLPCRDCGYNPSLLCLTAPNPGELSESPSERTAAPACRTLPDQVKETRFLWRGFLVAAVLTNVWLLLPWLIPAIPRPRWYRWAFLAPGLAPVIPLLVGHCIQALQRQWKNTLPPAVTGAPGVRKHLPT